MTKVSVSIDASTVIDLGAGLLTQAGSNANAIINKMWDAHAGRIGGALDLDLTMTMPDLDDIESNIGKAKKNIELWAQEVLIKLAKETERNAKEPAEPQERLANLTFRNCGKRSLLWMFSVLQKQQNSGKFQDLETLEIKWSSEDLSAEDLASREQAQLESLIRDLKVRRVKIHNHPNDSAWVISLQKIFQTTGKSVKIDGVLSMATAATSTSIATPVVTSNTDTSTTSTPIPSMVPTPRAMRFRRSSPITDGKEEKKVTTVSLAMTSAPVVPASSSVPSLTSVTQLSSHRKRSNGSDYVSSRSRSKKVRRVREYDPNDIHSYVFDFIKRSESRVLPDDLSPARYQDLLADMEDNQVNTLIFTGVLGSPLRNYSNFLRAVFATCDIPIETLDFSQTRDLNQVVSLFNDMKMACAEDEQKKVIADLQPGMGVTWQSLSFSAESLEWDKQVWEGQRTILVPLDADPVACAKIEELVGFSVKRGPSVVSSLAGEKFSIVELDKENWNEDYIDLPERKTPFINFVSRIEANEIPTLRMSTRREEKVKGTLKRTPHDCAVILDEVQKDKKCDSLKILDFSGARDIQVILSVITACNSLTISLKRFWVWIPSRIKVSASEEADLRRTFRDVFAIARQQQPLLRVTRLPVMTTTTSPTSTMAMHPTTAMVLPPLPSCASSISASSATHAYSALNSGLSATSLPSSTPPSLASQAAAAATAASMRPLPPTPTMAQAQAAAAAQAAAMSMSSQRATPATTSTAMMHSMLSGNSSPVVAAHAATAVSSVASGLPSANSAFLAQRLIATVQALTEETKSQKQKIDQLTQMVHGLYHRLPAPPTRGGGGGVPDPTNNDVVRSPSPGSFR